MDAGYNSSVWNTACCIWNRRLKLMLWAISTIQLYWHMIHLRSDPDSPPEQNGWNSLCVNALTGVYLCLCTYCWCPWEVWMQRSSQIHMLQHKAPTENRASWRTMMTKFLFVKDNLSMKNKKEKGREKEGKKKKYKEKQTTKKWRFPGEKATTTKQQTRRHKMALWSVWSDNYSNCWLHARLFWMCLWIYCACGYVLIVPVDTSPCYLTWRP